MFVTRLLLFCFLLLSEVALSTDPPNVSGVSNSCTVTKPDESFVPPSAASPERPMMGTEAIGGGGCGHILIYGHGELARIDPEMVKPMAQGMYGMPILKGMPPCLQDIRASRSPGSAPVINHRITH